MRKIAAIAVATVLVLDGALHLFWAVTGSHWPAASATGLSRGLLDMDVPFTPPVLIPLAVALFGAAGLVLARAGLVGMPGALGRRLPRRVSGWLPLLGTLGVAAGTGVRALAGLVYLVADDPASTFHRLNLAVYTPLCVLLCAAAVTVLRPARPARTPVVSRPGRG